ncbi:PC-Esterase [Dillenia turbinata]|uniref:PC-Esterase n=1 Tax=Dillenia turbinata TaxID=194707 RepID=A0AAN8W9Y0_9MAGN
MNVTRMTDYRKDGHPSIYRKQKLSDEERRSPSRFQDCSHWCLPGVPDAWNELLYAELLIKLNKDSRQQYQNHQRQKRTVGASYSLTSKEREMRMEQLGPQIYVFNAGVDGAA